MERDPDEVRLDKLFKKICRKMGTTLRDHSMIGEGDHVLVGLSGGKDSMILLQALAERQKALPFKFTITAAHVEAVGIGYRIDKEKLTEFCNNLDVPLHYLTIEPDLDKDVSKAACFVCSWHRRKKLFSLTKELKCDRLALGHHRNDAIETLLMNMIFHGSISSLPYTLEMFDGRLQLIRPLMDMDEGLLKEYAELTELDRIEKSCPHENRTRREDAAHLIEEIEKLNGKGPYNIFKSMDKICEEYLPGNQDKS